MQALQSFHRFTPGTNCRAWLVSILQHVRSNRRRKQGRVVIDSSVDEVTNVVPFVPPIPDHLTDEDMLLALQQIPRAPSGGDPALRRGRSDLQGNRGRARHPDRHGDVAAAPGPRTAADRTGAARHRTGRHRSGKRDALIMQCRDVRELADSFLSEQLLVETNHELLRHLDTCPDCRADMAGRRALRDGLRAAFARAETCGRDRSWRPNCWRSSALASPPESDVETFGVAIVVGARRGRRPGRGWRVVRAPLQFAIAPGRAGA